jgi:hypothetical protein
MAFKKICGLFYIFLRYLMPEKSSGVQKPYL